MKDLGSFFNLVFDNRLVSEQSLMLFTEDHLQKLVSKNVTGKYDHLIKDTSPLFYEYITAVKVNNSAEMERQKQTLSVDEVISELKEQVRRIEGYIRSMYSKKDNLYLEIFPNGLSEYCRVNKSNLEPKITRILVFLKSNPDVVNKDLREGIIRIHKEYQKARESQIRRKNKYKSSRTQKQEIRIELCKQLQKNLFSIAIDNLGDAHVASDYFNQKLLRERKRSLKNEELRKLGSFELSAR